MADDYEAKRVRRKDADAVAWLLSRGHFVQLDHDRFGAPYVEPGTTEGYEAAVFAADETIGTGGFDEAANLYLDACAGWLRFHGPANPDLGGND